MRDQEDIRDRSKSELDIQEIDNAPPPKKLKSRPTKEDLTQIGCGGGGEIPSSRLRSEGVEPSRYKKNSGLVDDRILHIAASIVMVILLLSNLSLIYHINSISNKQSDIESNISLIINKNNDILDNISSLKETAGKFDIDSSIANKIPPISNLAYAPFDNLGIYPKSIDKFRKISPISNSSVVRNE